MNIHADLLKAEFLAVSPSCLHFVSLLSWLFHHLLTASVSKFSVHNNAYKETICIFNWRMIVLQCCGGLCSTSSWISHHYIYTYISPPSWAYRTPPHPSTLHTGPLCTQQLPVLPMGSLCAHSSCLCYLWAPCVTHHLPLVISFTYDNVYLPLSQFVLPSPPLCPALWTLCPFSTSESLFRLSILWNNSFSWAPGYYNVLLETLG